MHFVVRLIRLVIFLHIIVSSTIYAQAPVWKWSKGVGSGNSTSDEAEDIATDKNGNTYITGHFEGSTSQKFLLAGNDTLKNVLSFFLIKYDSSGNILWTKNPSFVPAGSSKAYAHGVATDEAGNVYITGEYILMKSITFDDTTLFPPMGKIDIAFLAKYNPSGKLLWVRSAPSDNCESNAVTVDRNNNVYITGSYGNSSLLFDSPNGPVSITFDNIKLVDSYSGNGENGFIAKYDASGNVLWAKAITSTGRGSFDGAEVGGKGIITDNLGNAYITGYYVSSTTTFGTITINNTLGNYQPFIAKYDPDGNALWAKAIGTSRGFGNDIATSGCFVYVTGTTNKMFTAKYDLEGNPSWKISPSGTSSGSGITSDIAGNIYVTGNYSGASINFGAVTLTNTHSTSNEAYAVKYDGISGTALWAKDAGGSGFDLGTKISTDNRGNIFTLGMTYSPSASFDAISLNNPYSGNGAATMFTARLAQNQVPIPPLLSVNATATPDTCKRGVGTATVSITSGTVPPYTYSWTPSGGTTATVTGLKSGAYTVTVIDSGGCNLAIDTVNVDDVGGSSFDVTKTITDVKCKGNSTGAITVTPSGGIQPYVYSWSHSVTNKTSSANGLATGNYTVTVTDNNGTGCPNPISITVEEPAALTVTTAKTNVLCHGGTNGTATATSNGGTAPYKYSWNSVPVQTTQTASGLSGTATGKLYTVTVTDSNNCTTTANAIIIEPGALTASTTKTDISCQGSGSAKAIPSGGTAPYTYSWGPSGGIGAMAVNLSAAGTYTVTVKDSNNCTTTATAIITKPATVLSVTADPTNVSCYGGNNGTITAIPKDGTPQYTHSWNTSPVQTTPTITNLASGTYVDTIRDANNCIATISVTITEPDALTDSITKTDVLCYGDSTGTASVIVKGGSGTPTYSWNTSPPQLTADITKLTAGTYIVTITDSLKCIKSDTVVISSATMISPNISSTDANCSNMFGAVTANPSGGTAPYSYLWNTTPAQTDQSITGLPAGTYHVTVADAKNCTATSMDVLITEIRIPVASFTPMPSEGESPLDVAFLNTSSGAVSYQWDLGNGENSALDIPSTIYTQPGIYNIRLTAKSANGCESTVTESVKVSASSSLQIPNVFTPNGDGDNDFFKPIMAKNLTFMQITIFNRWGEKVYDWATNSGESWKGWDGTNKSGGKAPDGVYYYIINATGADGVLYPQKTDFISLISRKN